MLLAGSECCSQEIARGHTRPHCTKSSLLKGLHVVDYTQHSRSSSAQASASASSVFIGTYTVGACPTYTLRNLFYPLMDASVSRQRTCQGCHTRTPTKLLHHRLQIKDFRILH